MTTNPRTASRWDFMVGDLVRVPGLKPKHVLDPAGAESVASRCHGVEARVLEIGLPYGERGTRTGVLVEFTYHVLRRLPPDVGDGYAVDEAGELIHDPRTAQALVTTTMLQPTGAELKLMYDMRKADR